MPRPPSPVPDARAAALAALGGVLADGHPLEAALAAAPGWARLPARERAFARRLAATCLRRRGEIEALLGRCLDRPLPRGAGTVRHALALGIAQLLWLETPAHAAVDTAVALAGGVAGGRYRGLANAVLRRVARDGAALRAGLDPARLNTPAWLREGWAAAYGERTARRIAEAHLAEPPLDLTPRTPAEAAAWADRLDARVLPTGTLRRAAPGAVTELPGYAEGAWWVQDAAAALPARLIPAPAGRRVLDLCAAPGGKTLQLAAAGARVTAVDVSAERLARVRENLERTGLAAELVEADARDFAPEAPFDAVLLDAPCTGTGTLRRHPDIAHLKRPGDARRLGTLQDALLDAAARLLRPAGTLVYAVCSLEPAEGPERIAAFLERHPGFRRVAVAESGLGGLEGLVDAAGDLRTLPCHWAALGGLDGFHAARLQAPGEAAT